MTVNGAREIMPPHGRPRKLQLTIRDAMAYLFGATEW